MWKTRLMRGEKKAEPGMTPGFDLVRKERCFIS